jgi:flagellar biosynthetic protein FlhB
MLVIALCAPLALGGWTFSLGFKWERLDPIAGVARLFSWQSLMELVKALAKFLVVAIVAVSLLWAREPELLHLGREPLLPALAHTAQVLGWIFLILTLPMILVAGVDVPFQIISHLRQLRMTKQEVRDEMKDNEGKPEVKNRIRRLQQEFAQRRMMEKVPTADVIIINPDHYAVALCYQSETMSAPVIIAMGVDRVALRIRERAEPHRIPQVRAPLLARALYYNGALDKPIPHSLYEAVAQVLTYLYRLRRDDLFDGRPITMNDVPVPPTLRTQ